VAVLGLVSCGEDGGIGSQPAAEDEVEVEEIVSEVHDLLREVEQIVGTEGGPELALVARAQAILATQCLQEAGIDHTMPDPTQALANLASVLPQGARLWLAQLETFGVADAVSDPEFVAQLTEGEPVVSPEPPPGFDAAYWGESSDVITLETHRGEVGQVSIGGCSGEARRRLFGVDVIDYERARLALLELHDVHRTVAAREDVAGVASDWSRCMRDAGFRIDSPDDVTLALTDELVGVVERGNDTGALRELEEELATEDGACKRASGLRLTYGRAFVEEAEAALRATEGAAVVYREMREHAIAVGEALISSDER
jgi:hypothetical protein